MRLEDTTVLVTGASRGIGRAIAVAAAEAGARVALFFIGDSHDKRLEPPKTQSVKGTGPGAAGAVADWAVRRPARPPSNPAEP